jgi:hypothetical protein
MYNDYLSGKIKERDPSLRIPKAKVYWEGWIKYFHYNLGQKVDKPNAFFINSQYFHQKTLKTDRKKKDKTGKLSIPTKYHFYARLMKNGMNIMSSRDHQIMRTVAHLSLDIIRPVPEDAKYKGGIQDLGNFNEGKCIQVSTNLPAIFSEQYYSGRSKGMIEHWILCTDALNPKQSLLEMFVKMRILRQKSFGIKEVTKKKEESDYYKSYDKTCQSYRKIHRKRRKSIKGRILDSLEQLVSVQFEMWRRKEVPTMDVCPQQNRRKTLPGKISQNPTM